MVCHALACARRVGGGRVLPEELQHVITCSLDRMVCHALTAWGKPVALKIAPT
jgi:hypothetical protein